MIGINETRKTEKVIKANNTVNNMSMMAKSNNLIECMPSFGFPSTFAKGHFVDIYFYFLAISCFQNLT